jgi:hypothetical protein
MDAPEFVSPNLASRYLRNVGRGLGVAVAAIGLDWLLHYLLMYGACLAFAVTVFCALGPIVLAMLYYGTHGNRPAVVGWLVFGLVLVPGHMFRPDWLTRAGATRYMTAAGSAEVVSEANRLLADGKQHTFYVPKDMPPAIAKLDPTLVTVAQGAVRLKMYALNYADFNGYLVARQRPSVGATQSLVELAPGLYWSEEQSFLRRLL